MKITLDACVHIDLDIQKVDFLKQCLKYLNEEDDEDTK